jgi:hypothetical protein
VDVGDLFILIIKGVTERPDEFAEKVPKIVNVGKRIEETMA